MSTPSPVQSSTQNPESTTPSSIPSATPSSVTSSTPSSGKSPKETSSSLVAKLQELLPSLFESTQIAGDAYLRFELTSDILASFSMEAIQESLLVPAENITLLPNMPEAVMGLMSSRDRVFCLVDLAHLVGLSTLSTYSRQYHVIVLRITSDHLDKSADKKELLLGIAVNKIQGIVRSGSNDVRSPLFDAHPNLTPFIRGCVIAKDQELLVLDTKTIVKAALGQE